MRGGQDRANDVQGVRAAASGDQVQTPPERRHSRASPMLILRVGLPGGLMVAGIALLLANAIAIGLVLVSVAVISALVDFFAQLTITSGDDREREERARSTFAQTGSWPPHRRS